MSAVRRSALPRQPVEPWPEVQRFDLLDKVRGRTAYIDDLPDPPGTVYAVPVRSVHSHARVISIDASAAADVPGFLGILDRDHLDGLNPHVRIGEYAGHTGEFGLTAHQHFVTVDKARFDGDLLGMVAAVDLRSARRCAELVEVECEPLPAVFSAAAALAPGAPILHEDLGSNLACQDSFEWGDAETGLRQAERTFELSFQVPNVYHHPMEPVGSCLASFGSDAVTLWLPTNKPFNPIAQVSELFGVPPEMVRVRVPDIGGAFGAKQQQPAMMGALALSRRLGRPVRVVATEEDGFRATARHAAVFRGRVGVDGSGRLLALDVDLEIDTGAYFTGARLVTRNMCISSWGCYRLPSFRVRARTAYTNKVPAASFRATGKTQTTFALECLVDHVARELGQDPVEFRRRNVLQRGEYVADVWKVRGQEFPADTPPIDTDFEDLMNRALSGIGVESDNSPPLDGGVPGRRPGEGGVVSANPRTVRGRGLALSLRHGAQGGGRAYAMATLDARGHVRISHAAPDLGEGAFMMIALVAAHTLDIPVEHVTVEPPETSHGLNFEGSSAQRTTVHMGNAVRSACEALKKELVESAVQTRGGAADDWRAEGGRLWRGEESHSYAEIVSPFASAPSFEGHVALKGLGSYSYAPSEDRAFGGLDHWAPGAAAAEVEVDLETGEVTVVRLAAVADAGKAIHPPSALGQVAGGAVMGLGLGLFEELVYGDGSLQNGDAFQYRLPAMKDVPASFECSIVENGDGPGPFGSKGMAQTSIPCITPAIGNAIRDATGVHVLTAPFTPERVLRALGRLAGEPEQ